MAAFEAVSRLELQPIGGSTDDLGVIDLRTARLPLHAPSKTAFDPRNFRTPKSSIKPWMAYFNLFRLAFGPGMLAIPLAVSQAGIALGPIMVVAVGILVAHTHFTLLWCLNEIARQMRISFISYRYGFRLAMYHGPPMLHTLGMIGPGLIAFFMICSQIGICTVFVIFTTDNLRDIMDWESPVPSLLSLFVPYLILEVSMKTLKRVSYVSMGGNFLSFAGLFIVIYEMTLEPRREFDYINHRAIPVSSAFGILLFNTSAVGVVLSCEKALKNPKLMTSKFGVINMGIAAPSVVNAVFGAIAYWSYGSMEENILRSMPFDQYTSQTAFVIYLIAVALSFPLQCYPAIQIISEVIRNHDRNIVISDASLKALEYFTRPIFVSVTFLIAYLIPFQGPFVAFVGTFCTTALVLILPCLMEIGILYPEDYGRWNWLLVKDAIIVILALILWVVGIYLCGSLIYIRLMSLQSPIKH